MTWYVVFILVCGVGGQCVTVEDKQSGFMDLTACRAGIDDFTEYMTNDPKGVAYLHKSVGPYNMEKARGFCVDVRSSVPINTQIGGYDL